MLAFVSVDGPLGADTETLDEDQGLLFLDVLPITGNQFFNDVSARIAPGSDLELYRFATGQEAVNFVNNSTFPGVLTLGGTAQGASGELDGLFDLLGGLAVVITSGVTGITRGVVSGSW